MIERTVYGGVADKGKWQMSVGQRSCCAIRAVGNSSERLIGNRPFSRVQWIPRIPIRSHRGGKLFTGPKMHLFRKDGAYTCSSAVPELGFPLSRHMS
jgi:hypothetical protein